MPQPVTTPSPAILVFSMPKSVERCSTNMSNSSNEPSSRKTSMRSRAVSLPLLVLGVDARLAAAHAGDVAAALEFLQHVLHRSVPKMEAGICGNDARRRAQAPLSPSVLLRCNMTPLAFRGELGHMRPIGAWAGKFRPSRQMRLVASVFPLSGNRLSATSGEKAPWHDACGHDSAAEWTFTSARLVVSYQIFRRQVAPCRHRCLRPRPRERRLF